MDGKNMTKRAETLLWEAFRNIYNTLFKKEDIAESIYWEGAYDILKRLLEDER